MARGERKQEGANFYTHRMKRIGREEGDAREREGERECLDLALGPVSGLFQTCFRPLQKDHLIFAKPCPVAHAVAFAKPHRSNLRLQTNAFVTPCNINAWNCGAMCVPKPCLHGSWRQKARRTPMPLSRTGFPDFLEFLKLLASGDGAFFLTNPRTTDWLRKM